MKTTPILSKTFFRMRRAFGVIVFLFPVCGLLHAQDPLIAFGRIAPGGELESHYSPAGATIQVTKNGTGLFEIELTATGAFAGATVDDFHVGLTVQSSFSNDDAAAADISSVDADTLTIDVYTADLEDAVDTSNPEPRDVRFFFQVYRIPAGGVVDRVSTGLLACGRVGTGGSLLGGVTAFASDLSSTRPATGEYEITVSAPGQFVGDAVEDYSLALAVDETFNDDDLIRGWVSDVSSDDEVVVEVFVDDAQATSDDNNPDPVNNPFTFSIFRAPSATSSLPPGSAMLGALLRVEGTAGALLSSAMSYPGGSILSQRTDTGDYRLTISAPGAFAGRNSSDFSLMLQIHDGGISDEFCNGRIELPDADTMEVEVYVSDVEQVSEFGTPRDNDFSVMILNAFVEVQGDMLAGRTMATETMIGDDVYSYVPSLQRLRVRGKKKNGKARFFVRAENDGNLSRDLAVGSVGKARGVKSKFFRVSGGFGNVTAAVKTGTAVGSGIAPDADVLFLAKTKPRRNAKKKATIRLQTIDVNSGIGQDLLEARVKMSR